MKKIKKNISFFIVFLVTFNSIFLSYYDVSFASSSSQVVKEIMEDKLKDYFSSALDWALDGYGPLNKLPITNFFAHRALDYFDSLDDKNLQYSPSSGVVGTNAGNKFAVTSHGGGGHSRIPYDDESTYTHGGGGSSRPGTSHGGGGSSRPGTPTGGTSSGGTTAIPSTDHSVSGSTTNNYNSFSLLKSESVYNTTTNSYENKNYIYSPVTKTYNTVNKITYAPSYTTVNNTTNNTTNNYNNYTYNFVTNNYNYYVTNNYTYISYYITPSDADTVTGDGTDKSNDTYVELYYELPDGRNSYDLKAEDVWGQYNIYNVVGYESVAEDAGTTLALLHLDTDLKDSSYFKNGSATATSNVYTDGAFGQAKSIRGQGDYISLSLNKSLGSSWTIEFFLYVNNNNTNNTYGYFSGINFNSVSYYFSDPAYVSRLKGTWAHIAFCYNGSMSAYVNGRKVALSSVSMGQARSYAYGGLNVIGNNLYFGAYPVAFVTPTGASITGYRSNGDVFDEIRVSSGVVYTSDFAVPSQPFDTNQVLCVPSSASEHDIAVKGEYKISGYRIGGVRPTYPTNGYVFIALEDDKVASIQQYQSDGWYEVDAAIYEDGEWYLLKGFDMKAASFDGPPEDDNKGDTGGGSGDDKKDDDGKEDDKKDPEKPPGGGTVSGNGDGGGGGIWDSIKNFGGSVIDFILKALGVVLDLLAKLVDGLGNLLAPVGEMITSLLGFTASFSGFLGDALSFAPPELTTVLLLGLTLLIILAVIKFMRG